VFGKDAALWFGHIVEADSFLQDGYMLCRVELQLYCLPPQIPESLQAGDGRRFVWVGSRLQGVGATQGLVDERQAMATSGAEELTVVGAAGFVESSETGRGEFGVCAWL
jgi:hypothetical protein